MGAEVGAEAAVTGAEAGAEVAVAGAEVGADAAVAGTEAAGVAATAGLGPAAIIVGATVGVVVGSIARGIEVEKNMKEENVFNSVTDLNRKLTFHDLDMDPSEKAGYQAQLDQFLIATTLNAMLGGD